MMAQVGGYYRASFRGERGVTQGDPLLPTIFNVVVDAEVCHWEYLVAEREGGDRSDEEGGVAQMTCRTIRDIYDGQLRAEDRH